MRPTFTEFCSARLGSGSPALRLWRMFSRPATASTFREFWRLWSPAYGYVPTYFCYAPLRRILPPPIAFVSTFALSGLLLHDLVVWLALGGTRLYSFPVVTVAFIFIAIFVVCSDAAGLSLEWVPRALRVACHLGVICVVLVTAVCLSYAFRACAA